MADRDTDVVSAIDMLNQHLINSLLGCTDRLVVIVKRSVKGALVQS